MKNKTKIAYWAVTAFLAVGMLAGGIQQLFQIGGYNKIVSDLGYPLYLLSIIGAWKLLGVVAILLPSFRLLKEWAYAGFFFAMSGAFISHLVVGQAFTEAIPSLILLTVTVLSWYLRPADRKLVAKELNAS
ncbi:DoxX-like family protein [Pelobium manganitolerans]|uniref:DoxX-like family protein n=1 Tax=Pelobium manganitolerans TaxID=1842495 RepID=A0A419S330_9SPHI|nr:DoxX family protein [Pelobium manganitolerans]RKD13695.1 DoxX-like family protein [Pelobium manganitolerans]